jgi:hypothetical protein
MVFFRSVVRDYYAEYEEQTDHSEHRKLNFELADVAQVRHSEQPKRMIPKNPSEVTRVPLAEPTNSKKVLQSIPCLRFRCRVVPSQRSWFVQEAHGAPGQYGKQHNDFKKIP